jgi:hypothetical protein
MFTRVSSPHLEGLLNANDLRMRSALQTRVGLDALPRWSSRRVLTVTLVVSMLIHALGYAWLPLVELFSTPTIKRFDATLAPMQAQPPNATGVGRASPAQKPRPRAAESTTQPTPDRATPIMAETASSEGSGIPMQAPSATQDDLSTSAKVAVQANKDEAIVATPRVEDPAPAMNTGVTAEPPRVVSPLPAFAEQISIDYKLTSPITDGVANFRWTRTGEQYEIESSVQATGFLVSAFAGVIHQKSAGEVTEEGLRPRQFFIRRGEGEAETAEFLHANNALTLKRRNEGRVVPLARGLQDMQSFLFQLAYLAPRLSNSDERIDMMVTNARKVYRYQFQRVGVETLQTRFGPVETIRLISEAANPEDAYEVWLAPAYQYLPVKLRYYLGRFRVEQLATRIGSSGGSGGPGNAGSSANAAPAVSSTPQ